MRFSSCIAISLTKFNARVKHISDIHQTILRIRICLTINRLINLEESEIFESLLFKKHLALRMGTNKQNNSIG